MDKASIITVQQLIDAQAYPPTHQYDVATLTPRGVLAERVQALLTLCPTFFEADVFLDVGASKGYFSLRAARTSRLVLALEPEWSVLRLWYPVCPPNVFPLARSFREIADGTRADMIWVGNGHHYLCREDPEQWLTRLCAMATDRVVIEGADGPCTRDFEDWRAGTVPLASEWLRSAADLGLNLIASTPSPAYTPGRSMWYLRKMR